MSHSFRGVEVTDLVVHRCDSCGELVWNLDELAHIRRVVEVKLRSKAA